MFKSYLKISIRNLVRNRTSSTVNILGLTIGLSCGILIFLLVSYLSGFDAYHAKARRTYWVVTDINRNSVLPSDATPRPLAAILRKDYPAVETAVRVENLFGQVISIPGTSSRFEESRNICFTESQFFQVFDVKWLRGNASTALSAPNTVVLSDRYAKKYFGTEDVLGKVLRLDNQANLTVTGVIAEPPSNTRLSYEVMISYNTIASLSNTPGILDQWDNTPSMCFVVMRKNAGSPALQEAINTTRQKYLSAEQAKTFDFHPLPLSELGYNMRYGGTVPRPLLYTLAIIGILLVSAACINFVNMATAQALKRSKEVGVRKAVGSTRGQLIGQFLVETGVLTFIALIFSLLLVQLNLPLLNNALSVLRADLSVLNLLRPASLWWFGSLITGVVLLAGLYPALVLARFKPDTALRGRINTQQIGGISLRKVLVVTQFFIAQLFIIAVIVMTAQVRYIQQTDLGFNKTAIFTVNMPPSGISQQQLLREKLMQTPGVEQVTIGLEIPASPRKHPVSFSYDHHTTPEPFTANLKIGDMNYIPLFGLHMIAGRNFLNNDSINTEAIVSAMMVKQLGVRNPEEILGKQINIWGMDKTIVGVVADFHSEDLHNAIQPLIIMNYFQENQMAAIRLNPANMQAAVQAIERTWSEIYPDNIFHSAFVDDITRQFYLTERILLVLIQAFSLVAILIGCLGLYGLVTFMAEAKTKEIGVRKVLGATVE
ncbi:MAG TPA: ABC transporter permease, partial [Chitinophaga sp.]|nr:ABC transporter permease [Chitinophaga sp.]